MKEGYLLQVIVGVICNFFLCMCVYVCITFPSLVVKQGVVLVYTSLCVALLFMHSKQILLSKRSAVPYTVHMEEIKVRHGAKARNGALVLIRYVSVVTCRGHSILAKRPGNSVVPVDDQNLLFQTYY